MQAANELKSENQDMLKSQWMALIVGVVLTAGCVKAPDRGAGEGTAPREGASVGHNQDARERAERSDVRSGLMQPATRDEVAAVFSFIPADRLDDGRRFVSVDIEALAGLALHDSFELDLLPGQPPVVALVERQDEIEGATRLVGTFLGMDGEENRFSMTLAEDGSYVAGNFDLRGHALGMEALRGKGWVSDLHVEERVLIEQEDAHGALGAGH